MKVAVYTSLATNYFAKARALAASLQHFSPNVDLYGLICDDPEHDALLDAEGFKDIWFIHEYPRQNVNQWIFKHSIMELCTAGKGWALRRLLDAGYDYVFYLDPDCWAFSDLNQLIEALPDGKSVSVVPHTLHPADTVDEIEVVELSSLKHGIFNLGYLLVKNDEDGRKFADWWANRLDLNCTDDFSRGLFTDQRWIDLAVGYFDFVDICRHPGVDVATWNVRHRDLQRSDGGSYTIDGYPLIFYHFSGVGPNSVHRWVRERLFPDDAIAADLEIRYEQEIGRFGQSEIAPVRPRYDFFADGIKIENSMRKAYWNDENLRNRFPDPYSIKDAEPLRTAILQSSESAGKSLSPSPVLPLKVRGSQHSAITDFVVRKMFQYHSFNHQSGNNLSRKDAWQAYCEQGWENGFEPNSVFDTNFYKFQLGDDEDMSQYKTPLHHFVSEGIARGLRPSIAFEESYYLKSYPDVAKQVRKGTYYCGYHHFVRVGMREQRRGCRLFLEQNYLAANADVKATVDAGHFLSGAQHYWSFGLFEGRTRGD